MPHAKPGRSLSPIWRITQGYNSRAPMSITSEIVNLKVDDGTTMRAHVARPAGTPRAGLIVFQEIFGINPHIRDIADRFAAEGYLAIAPELFHRTGPGFESGYTDMAERIGAMKKLSALGRRSGRGHPCRLRLDSGREPREETRHRRHRLLHGRPLLHSRRDDGPA